MTQQASEVDQFLIKPLSMQTWDAFASLVERHNGVWGGCWCTWFHPACDEKGQSPERSRALKRRLVEQDQAHAALVFDGEVAVAWCEYGSPAELPTIYHRKDYEAGLSALPDYRITCFFVDRGYRRRGMAERALRGALELIAAAGGGVVEGYPQDTGGRRISASFLYNGSRTQFEKAGFRFERPKGKNHCVMTTVVAGAADPAPAVQRSAADPALAVLESGPDTAATAT